MLLIWANGWVLNVCEESGREVGLDEFDWISVRLTCGRGRKRRVRKLAGRLKIIKENINVDNETKMQIEN